MCSELSNHSHRFEKNAEDDVCSTNLKMQHAAGKRRNALSDIAVAE